jgi:nucleoside-diphosphate-sugar epimerase
MFVDKSKPVLVTGGNGYMASWLVTYLLEEGVDVHATVRDPSNMEKVGHLLKAAEGKTGKLTLFAADLKDENAFDEPMQGCGVVFHTASPFLIQNVSDVQSQLIDPVVHGTKNVLETCSRTESVTRVVLTSSIVSIRGDNCEMEERGLEFFTEEHWNETSSVVHQPYAYSKVIAEKTAWEIAGRQHRWDLVVLNPGFLLGPSLTTASDSTSLATIKQLADGSLKYAVPDLRFAIVDVRDVATAHIKAGFIQGARGRHILYSGTMSLMDITDTLKKHWKGKYPFPWFVGPKFLFWLVAPMFGLSRKFVTKNVGYNFVFDNSYSMQDLDMTFRPVGSSIIAHFKQMVKDKIV